MSELSKNTLFNFFAGHATPLQQKLIGEWMRQDKNEELYYEWLEEWEREHPQFLPDTEMALQAYMSRIHDSQNNMAPQIPETGLKRSRQRIWLKVLNLAWPYLCTVRVVIQERSIRIQFKS